ncbi:BQ2448_7245 [Microbotryum intermedium]|uniref:BQ2448_7245 protein n=1 Tax=Microbotryum intermedium TaxID=269621 RepID=A0A238FKJ4_9BASI|nr:BQ2448_7245 [Microbotryum intermedium]
MTKWIDRWYKLLHTTTKNDAPSPAGVATERRHDAPPRPSTTRTCDVDDTSYAARSKSTTATTARFALASSTAVSCGQSQSVVRRTSSITLHISPKHAVLDTEIDSLANSIRVGSSIGDCDDTTTTLRGDGDPDRRRPRHSEPITSPTPTRSGGSNASGQDVKNVQDNLTYLARGSEPRPLYEFTVMPEKLEANGTATPADPVSSRLAQSTTRHQQPYATKDCSASSSPAISRSSSLCARSSIAESPSDEDQKPETSSSIRLAANTLIETPSPVAFKEPQKMPPRSETPNKPLRRWSIHFNAPSWKTDRTLPLPPPPPPPSSSSAGPTASSLRAQTMRSEFLYDAISKPAINLRPRSLSTKSTLKMKTRRRKKVFGVGDGDDSHSAGSSDQDERQGKEDKIFEIRQREASMEIQGLLASRCSSPPSILSTHASSPTLYDESLESRDYFDDRGTSSTGSHINVQISQRKEGEPVRRHSDDYSRYYRAPVARYFAPIATEFAPYPRSDSGSSPPPRLSHTPAFPRGQLSRHQSLGSTTQLRPLSPLSSPAESPDLSPPRGRHRSATVYFADTPSLPSPTSLSSAFGDPNDAPNPPKSPSSIYKMKRSQSRARRRTQSTGSSGFRGPPPAGHAQLPLLSSRVGSRRSVTSESDVPTSPDSQERSIFGPGDGEPTPIVESVYVAKAWSIDTEFAAGSGGEDDGLESGSNGRKFGTTLKVINPDDASSGSSTPVLSPNPSDSALTPASISTSSSSSPSSDSTPETTPTPTPNLMSSTPTLAISYFPTPAPPLSALPHRASKDPLDSSTTSSIPFPTSPRHHQAVGIAV